MKSPGDLIIKIEDHVKDIGISSKELAGMIDHTELKPYKPIRSIIELCNEAKRYNFHSVCVNPFWTKLCNSELRDSEVKIVTAIGFPLGQTTLEEKVFETEQAIEEGADELDMVMNIGAFRNRDYEFTIREIKSVVEAAEDNTVKVIIETGYLTYEDINKACEIVRKAGADYVKNSTGFGPLKATIPHIISMRKSVSKGFGVKAAGGIRDYRDALRMIAAGADRIGSSSGVNIIKSYENKRDTSVPISENPCTLCPSNKSKVNNMPGYIANYYIGKCDNCQCFK